MVWCSLLSQHCPLLCIAFVYIPPIHTKREQDEDSKVCMCITRWTQLNGNPRQPCQSVAAQRYPGMLPLHDHCHLMKGKKKKRVDRIQEERASTIEMASCKIQSKRNRKQDGNRQDSNETTFLFSLCLCGYRVRAETAAIPRPPKKNPPTHHRVSPAHTLGNSPPF